MYIVYTNGSAMTKRLKQAYNIFVEKKIWTWLQDLIVNQKISCYQIKRFDYYYYY